MYAVSLDMLNNFNGKEFRLVRAITSCTPMFDLGTNKYIARSRSSSHLSLLINTLTFGHSRSFDQLTPIYLRVNLQTGKVVQSLPYNQHKYIGVLFHSFSHRDQEFHLFFKKIVSSSLYSAQCAPMCYGPMHRQWNHSGKNHRASFPMLLFVMHYYLLILISLWAS